jgi:hypothetical protein
VTKAWPKPNYVNPETRGSLKVVLNVALYTILLCFVGLRIFTRTYLRKIFGGDDVLILLALVRQIFITLCCDLRGGVTRRIWWEERM